MTKKKHKKTGAATRSSIVTPSRRFIGTVLADGQDANVLALAALENGETLLLDLSGPRTTVAAIAATMHRAKSPKPVSFFPRPGESWGGPDHLKRSEALGSSTIATQIGPTVYQNLAIIANAANIGYCCLNPVEFPGDPQTATSAPSVPPASEKKRRVPPARFVFATEGSAHPDWLTFTGMMRTLRLPFPLEAAPLVWAAGIKELFEPLANEECLHLTGSHTLLEPIEHTLGIEAWQIIPTRQWEVLIEHITDTFPS